MQDLAMYILEILMNSISADSSLIKILIEFSKVKDLVMIIVEDNGKGMDEEMVKRVVSPFTTTRTTRKVGMGVAFMKELCDECEGKLLIESKVGKGTRLTAKYKMSHIDAPVLGDIGEMMMFALQANEAIDYEFVYKEDNKEFVFKTHEIRQELGDVKLDDPSILLWIKDYINQEIKIRREI